MNGSPDDHVRPDWITRLLHRPDARLESAEQFAFFVRVVLDEWQHGTPGLRSSSASQAELARLGAIIQTSYREPIPPSLCFHVEWIIDVLHDARLSATLDHARRKERDVPGAADHHHGNQLIQIWAQVDIHEQTQRTVAQRFDVSGSTVNRRVASGRRQVHDALRRAGRLRL